MDESDDKKDDIVNKLLCNSCLCMGRTLHKITEEKLARFYLGALQEISSQTSSLPMLCPPMCWECKASLKKAAAFKEQVQDSHRILQAYTNESLKECLVSDIVRPSRLRTQLNSFVSIDPEPQTETAICSPASDRLDTQQCVFFKDELKNEGCGVEREDEPMTLDDDHSDVDNTEALETEVASSKKKKKKKNKLESKVKKTDKVVKRLQRGAKMAMKPKYPEIECEHATTEDPIHNIKTECMTDETCDRNDYVDPLNQQSVDNPFDNECGDLPSQLVEVTHDINSTEDLVHNNTNYKIASEDINENDAESDWEVSPDEIPQFNFEGIEGPAFEINGNTTPVDVFNEIVDAKLINYLVDCANANGARLSSEEQSTKTKCSRFSTFKPTDSEEMTKFFALTLLHGHIKIPISRKLFSYDDPLYHHPIFTHAMSGRRYEQLVKCFSATETGDENFKNFLDIVTQIFRNKCRPGIDLYIEEFLVEVNNRLYLRNSVEAEKTNNSMKFYTLTDIDGYVLNLETDIEVDMTDSSKNPGVKFDTVVLNLLNPYLNKGHNVYISSLYNSVRMSQILLDLKTYSSGVLSSDSQDIPIKIQNIILKENQRVWLRKKKVYLSKWQCKKPVYAVTTKDYPQFVQVKTQNRRKMLKPKEIIVPTSHLRSSRLDMMADLYSCPRKKTKLEQKVLFHILDICVWNSFVLFKKHSKAGSKYDYVMFREDIIKKFLQLDQIKGTELGQRNKYHGRRFRQEIATPIVKNIHWPVKTEVQIQDPKKKKAPYRNCKLCYKKKLRKETCFKCEGCPDEPPLCPGCFKEWHETYAPTYKDNPSRIKVDKMKTNNCFQKRGDEDSSVILS